MRSPEGPAEEAWGPGGAVSVRPHPWGQRACEGVPTQWAMGRAVQDDGSGGVLRGRQGREGLPEASGEPQRLNVSTPQHLAERFHTLLRRLEPEGVCALRRR